MKAEQLGIVADDLTGALDTGVQFSKWGLSSLVSLKESVPAAATCLIVNTDSRAIPPGDAAEKARRAAQLLRGRLVYKKIDSTLRGNLGAEILAVMQTLGLAKAVVAPSFPANGRTMRGGKLFVQGVLLEQTGFARDPRNAISESHVPSLLRRQTGESVDLVTIDTVERGCEAVHEAICRSASRLVVADAESQQHLVHIAQAVVRAEGRWLPVGSAGLAEELPAALGLAQTAARASQARAIPVIKPGGPILVVAGSRNPTTAEQVDEAIKVLKWPAVEPDVEQLTHGDTAQSEIDRLAERTTGHLVRSGGCIVTTCFTPLQEDRSAAIAWALGQATRQSLDRQPVHGLLLTGGDIALQACLALDAEALRPVTEVLPGLPVSLLVGGPWANMSVITKAGGFGARNAILLCLQYFIGGTTRS